MPGFDDAFFAGWFVSKELMIPKTTLLDSLAGSHYFLRLPVRGPPSFRSNLLFATSSKHKAVAGSPKRASYKPHRETVAPDRCGTWCGNRRHSGMQTRCGLYFRIPDDVCLASASLW